MAITKASANPAIPKKWPVFITDIMGDVVGSMNWIVPVNWDFGRNVNLLKGLNDKDNSISYKGTKYPLVAMVLPVLQQRGGSQEYYSSAKIPRLIIATITTGEKDVPQRFKAGETFKAVLSPLYYEFLRCLALSNRIVEGDPEAFRHTYLENPGTQPVGEGSSDFIDSIELLNLEFTINQLKTC